MSEERVLGIHWLARTLRAGSLSLIMEPAVPAVREGDIRTRTTDDKDVLHIRAALQRCVRIQLQGNVLAAPHTLISSDQEAGVAIQHPVGERIR